MTWQELVDRNWDEFDIQSDESYGLRFRGPIEKVALEGGMFRVYAKWGAVSRMGRPWEICPDGYDVGVNVEYSEPYTMSGPAGDTICFTLPYIGTARFVKGHLDRTEVNG